jgi:thymidylate synthase
MRAAYLRDIILMKQLLNELLTNDERIEIYKQWEKNLPSLDLPNFSTLEQVEQSTYTDYKIINYQCNTHIKADMIA